MFTKRSILTTLLCVACVAHSQRIPESAKPRVFPVAVWSPLRVPVFSAQPKLTKRQELVSALRVNNRQIKLENTSLAELRREYGGELGQQGDASEYLQWLCLSGGTGEQRWVLWIESGEVDGGKVGGFQLRRIEGDVQLDKRCRIVQTPASVAMMPNPLTVGMTEPDIVRVLGKPSLRKKDALYYEHQRKVMVRGNPYDVTNTVTLLMRDGIVAAIQVWKTTSS